MAQVRQIPRTGMMILALAMVVGFTAVAGGCRSLTPPAQTRTIHTGDGVSVRLVHFEATRRGAYVVVDGDGNIKIAAEPPPDAALDITADTTAALKAMLEKVEVEGTLRVEVVEKIVKLTERTQAVVLMRDAMFRLAEMHINGVIDASTYREMYNKSLAGAIALAARDAEMAEKMLDYLLREQLLRSIPQEHREQLLRQHLGVIHDTSDLLNPGSSNP